MIEFLRMLRQDTEFVFDKNSMSSDMAGLLAYLDRQDIADIVEYPNDTVVTSLGTEFDPEAVLRAYRAEEMSVAQCSPMVEPPASLIGAVPETGMAQVIGGMYGAVFLAPAGADVEIIGDALVRNKALCGESIRYTVAGPHEFVAKIVFNKATIAAVYGVPTIVSMLG